MTSNTSPKHGIGFVLYASAVAALGGLIFGYDTAVIAGTVDFLQARFQLTDLALGWTVSSALLGSVAGAAGAGWMGDALGRKRSLLVCAVLFFLSAVWSGLANSAGELAAFVFRRPESPYYGYQLNLRAIDPAADYEVTEARTYTPDKPSRLKGAELQRYRASIDEQPGSLLLEYKKLPPSEKSNNNNS